MGNLNRRRSYRMGAQGSCLVAVLAFAACTIDVSKLRGLPKQDAGIPMDAPVDLADGTSVGSEMLDTADLADGTSVGPEVLDTADLADDVIASEDVDTAPESDAQADSSDLPPSKDVVVSPGDTIDTDAEPESDVPQAADVAADSNGDVGAEDSLPDGSVPDGGTDVKADAAGADAGTDAILPPSCGGAGQVCCAGNACSNSGCCAGSVCVASGTACPSTVGSGTCSNGACGNCGGANGSCCSNSTCTAANTFCHASYYTSSCVACGGSGDPCCPGNLCLDGGCCIADQYGVNVATCQAAGAMCGTISSTCTAGECGTCGALGDPCCANSHCTAPNTICQRATGGQTSCIACGGAGQPCCANPTPGETATCSAGLTCQTTTTGRTVELRGLWWPETALLRLHDGLQFGNLSVRHHLPDVDRKRQLFLRGLRRQWPGLLCRPHMHDRHLWPQRLLLLGGWCRTLRSEKSSCG